MKKMIAFAVFVLTPTMAHAEYEQVNLTVFGMDCAPCAHAIHVSMKGIQGVDTVDVDLNTGLVAMKLSPGNSASMKQFNQAVEKNGFAHKDADVVVKGKLKGTANVLILEVSGTGDRYSLVSDASGQDTASLVGKTVTVTGVIPQSPKGKLPDTLRAKTILEVR